jgi:serine/threonine protein kinase
MDLGAVTLGRYELRAILARGPMSTVHEGWDSRIGRKVAIKIIQLPDETDPDAADQRARARRDAQSAGGLQHPNIVGIYDYVEAGATACIVMEFIDGPSLKALFDRHERFGIRQVSEVMEQVLAALQFSHARGIVHRDIKPSNIMLTSDERAKIVDFGIARIESSNMTQVGTVMGTPAYMSPEQFMGEVVDARTDIYSAGVVLYQMLTGERPYEGGAATIMHKVLHTSPPKPSQISTQVSPALDGVVATAMAKRREDRFPSAKAFAEALRSAASAPVGERARMAVSSEEATRVTPPQRAVFSKPPRQVFKPPSRRSAFRHSNLVATAAGLLAFLGIGGIALVLTRQDISPQPATVHRASSVAEPANTSATTTAPVSPAPASPPAAVPPAPSPLDRPASAPSTTPANDVQLTQQTPTAEPAPPPPVPAPVIVPPHPMPPQPAPTMERPARGMNEGRPSRRPLRESEARRRKPDRDTALLVPNWTAPGAEQRPDKPAAPPPSGHMAQPHSWIGVSTKPVSAEVASRLGMQGPTGVLVIGLAKNGPGAKANLRRNDVITAFNGISPDSPATFDRAIQALPVGGTAFVEVWRDNQIVTLEMTTEANPEEQHQAQAADRAP